MHKIPNGKWQKNISRRGSSSNFDRNTSLGIMTGQEGDGYSWLEGERDATLMFSVFLNFF